jgi:hypothetical protein
MTFDVSLLSLRNSPIASTGTTDCSNRMYVLTKDFAMAVSQNGFSANKLSHHKKTDNIPNITKKH